jgi:hypothetical protein
MLINQNIFFLLKISKLMQVIEQLRHPFEFMYEIGLELFIGSVIGSIYTNFIFHDLQEVSLK